RPASRQEAVSMKVVIATVLVALVAVSASADPLTCNLNAYKAPAGLSASAADNTLAVTWEGEKGAELRMRFGIDGGAPLIREIAVRKNGGPWGAPPPNRRPPPPAA